MFGSFLYSFKDKIAYGTPSGGSGGGSGTSDDPYYLGTIYFGGGDSGGDGDGGGSGGGGNTTPSEPEPTVEIVDVQYVETAIISGSGTSSISGPVTLVIAEEYIIEHGAALEAAYAAQNSIVQSLNIDISGLSVAQIQSTIESLRQATDPWAPASWFHFAVAEGFEAYPGFFEDLGIVNQISDAHLEAIALVEQGHSIAEAQMIANGTTADEFVFTDEAGNYAEADVINNDPDIAVASGIDVSQGLIIIDPVLDGLPNFALPARPGMDPYDATDTLIFSDWGEPPIQTPHAYSMSFDVDDALTRADGLEAFEAALSNRPTPGNSQGASINGTINDVGALDPITPDWLIDNLVYSFRVPNSNPNQTDYFINHTQSEHHQASDGIVVHHGEIDDDGTLTHHVYGEGDAFLQNTGIGFVDEFVANRTYAVWEGVSTQLGLDALDF